METQPTGQRTSSPPSSEPTGATVEERAASSQDVGWEHRLEECEARIEHLERQIEGLQDALYRHEVLDKENIAELHRRTDPEQMARHLSQDARKRGL
jgi:hypothetical protein